MKIILEFDHDEIKQAEQSFRGPEYASAAQDFRLYLRSVHKHGDYDEETTKLINQINYEFDSYFGALLNG